MPPSGTTHPLAACPECEAGLIANSFDAHVTVLELFFITSFVFSSPLLLPLLYLYPWIYYPATCSSPEDLWIVSGIWLKGVILLGVFGVSSEALSHAGWFFTGQPRRGGLRHLYGYPVFRIYCEAFYILAAMLGKLAGMDRYPDGRLRRKGDAEDKLGALFGRLKICFAPGWSAHAAPYTVKVVGSRQDLEGSLQEEGRSKKEEE